MIFLNIMEKINRNAYKIHESCGVDESLFRICCRSLEIFYQHGKTHSELLKTQRNAGGCGLGGPLRYPNSIILWLRCNKVRWYVHGYVLSID